MALTYEDVKCYIEVESKSGCKLLSKEYENCRKTLLLQCKCGNEFERNFAGFKNKKRTKCSICSNKEKWTYEKVKDYIENISKSGCKLLSNEYSNLTEKMNLLCKCGNIFYVGFNAFKWNKKQSCNECSFQSRSDKKIKTHKNSILENIKKIHNGKIVLVGQYNGGTKDALFKNLECGHEWVSQPTNIAQGVGCPECNLKTAYCHEEIIAIINEKYDNEFKVLSEYINYHGKLTVKHMVCDTEYETSVSELFAKMNCPYCLKGSRSLNIDIIKRRLYDKYGNEFVLVGNEYKGMIHKYIFKHDCGNLFEAFLETLLYTDRVSCPVCNQSKGEKRIEKWLLDNHLTKDRNYIFQKQFNNLLGLGGGKLSYDFYLPNHNLLIEYQGEFHDGTAKHQSKLSYKRQQEHDRRKRKFALNNNINLLEIWYYDFDNIEKILTKELIKNKQIKKIT